MKTLKRILTALILLAVMVYVVMFTMGNNHQVTFDPIVWPVFNASLAMLMIFAFCAGVALSALFASVFLVKGSHQKRKVVKELKKTNKELEQIKSA